MKLRWTAPALRDLEAIGDYIARDNPAAADRVVTRILDQAELLAVHAHAGRAGRVPETREMIVSDSPFVLPYRVRGEVVEVLAVFHGSRQWPDSFN
ncbi:type II toxin-antitoxin system RelE/ParE family toxin [Methylosinus sp. Sm6]|uniref:type II toxin-antitoxin system RelE/ParE family toxin n=1 Tax=Methylosinus sp. Sm6 TaxID=2866948 RepID=UPI001C99FD61|nr:type II toxin-antitoxin system RelE/ParE family toxin [Methylosinus sp. Sm6]MBY6242974.1 type II toxin-antitoxin system RelE/ParE family toxin [Methylosinus sp. Sm6]